VKADPTVPVSLASEVVTASGVVNVLMVEDVPTPPLFVAVVVTESVVPGDSESAVMVVVVDVSTIADPPPRGVKVAV
jgi:hypothetical protein